VVWFLLLTFPREVRLSSRIDFFESAASCTGAPIKSITFRDGLYGSGTPVNALRIGRRAIGTYNKLLLNVNGF
jgi:hypothetical protein